GWAPAYLGTLGLDAGEGLREIPNTTPFPVELAGLMAEVRQAGCRSLAMEVSSHALVENRVAGVDFDAVVFTNLTQDHLDYHHTMEAYEEAKRLLFTAWRDSSLAAGKPWQGAVNIADPTGLRWSRDLGDRILTFGPAASGAGLAIDAVEVRADRIRLKVGFQGRTAESELKIGGLFNVENAGACLAGLICMGAPFEDAVLALESVRAVPGRFEAVPNDQGLAVIVDYAHTLDALVQLLRSARAVAEGRIITVFGCGGDRDRTKRPRMAEAAAQGSDLIFVTSDNPRTEDPEQILDDVVAGIPPGTESVREADRPTAIVQAIRAARPGDLVVIAGKGHENYQIIGRTKHPMDDRELARAGLALR
ncbi:MAG: UDP-N-acetylmuramoyl-L-alanyl-D-glutamate--2,6-diaminopimelate ligase, partial [Fimbriimonadaceae bacterium]|nr:UDP-N-acetylmuramoyl-L-alanyl-D-glutamate--2,6-diaminopimelate ligase [Fimbriimonadaceae bacterium]